MVKHNGKYYLLMISHVFAPGRHRREVCYRADNIHGPYEKKTILETDFGGFPHVGQGTIVDTQDGDWYGIIFQDRGGVGRVLTLMPCRWIDGWPMLGDEEGRIPLRMRPLVSGQPVATIVKGDDFASEHLGLHWQWNHNPDPLAWSLKEHPGFLRLKTSRVVENLFLAPNTLTQRMEGPTCTGTVALDFSHMKDGDCAGFSAFNGDSGVLTVKRKGRKYMLEMSEQTVVGLFRGARTRACISSVKGFWSRQQRPSPTIFPAMLVSGIDEVFYDDTTCHLESSDISIELTTHFGTVEATGGT